MKTVPLGEVTERVSTWNPAQHPDLEFTYVDLGAVDNTKKCITSPAVVMGREAPSRARQLIQAKDVLVSTVRPNLNAVAIVDPQLDGATASTGFTILRPTNQVDPNYLFHWVRTPLFVSDMVRKATGASYPAVSDRIVKESLIPLPPLDEQRRIAAILDQAGSVRQAGVKATGYLDELVQSAYFDMFGTPLRESAQKRKLGDVCEVVTGNTPSRSDAANYGDEIEWIKSDNLVGTIASRADEFLSTAGKAKARIAPAGAVLVTCIAGSPASIGRCSLVDRDVAFNQQINAAIPNAEMDSRFLLEQLKLAPELVRRKSTGGMKGLVSKTNFMSIEVQVPPLEHQREFVAFARKVDAVRTQRELADSEVERAVCALQSRAFSGQL